MQPEPNDQTASKATINLPSSLSEPTLSVGDPLKSVPLNPTGILAPNPPKGPTKSDESATTLHKILSAVGLVGGPAGLVALFCQILSVPERTTAALSLMIVCLITICYFRRKINAHIPASLLLSVLIGLATIFFVNYQNILLKNTGLIKYYHQSSELQDDMSHDLGEAKEEIWFFGTDFHISARDRQKVILAKLAQGLKVHYLILNPFSTNMDKFAADFDQSPSSLRQECRDSWESLLELRQKWQQASVQSPHPGELEIRLFEVTPRMRAYVFDPERTEEKTYVVPYINCVNSPELPGFQFQNIDKGVGSDYFSGVKKLWIKSITIDDYLKTLPSGTKSDSNM